jgi:hypothetical protein
LEEIEDRNDAALTQVFCTLHAVLASNFQMLTSSTNATPSLLFSEFDDDDNDEKEVPFWTTVSAPLSMPEVAHT